MVGAPRRGAAVDGRVPRVTPSRVSKAATRSVPRRSDPSSRAPQPIAATTATSAATRTMIGRPPEPTALVYARGMHSAHDLLTRWPALDVAAKRARLQDTFQISSG